jgi:dUTP pyrophosphatase
VRVRIHRLSHGKALSLPGLASAGSAGVDVRAAIPEPIYLQPGERRLIPSGFAVEVPPGWEGQVRPRSGLALEQGVTVLNAPGTIDSDYRGEVQVLLINLGDATFTVRPGDRIAQLMVARVEAVEWEEVAELPASDRGAGGFGSTGQR